VQPNASFFSRAKTIWLVVLLVPETVGPIV